MSIIDKLPFISRLGLIDRAIDRLELTYDQADRCSYEGLIELLTPFYQNPPAGLQKVKELKRKGLV